MKGLPYCFEAFRQRRDTAVRREKTYDVQKTILQQFLDGAKAQGIHAGISEQGVFRPLRLAPDPTTSQRFRQQTHSAPSADIHRPGETTPFPSRHGIGRLVARWHRSPPSCARHRYRNTPQEFPLSLLESTITPSATPMVPPHASSRPRRTGIPMRHCRLPAVSPVKSCGHDRTHEGKPVPRRHEKPSTSLRLCPDERTR